MTKDSEAPILTEVKDQILLITINRPKARNAMNFEAAQLLEKVLDDYDDNPELSVAIITGAGGTFCAGQDLKEASVGKTAGTKTRGGFGIMQRPPKKPIIAAVEGPVLAGGFEMALSCDLIVASRTSRFGLPEVKRALLAIGGALFRLPQRIPYHLAMEMVLTGDPQTAERMHSAGFVSRLADEGEAVAEAFKLAKAMAVNAPLSLQAGKEVVSRAANECWTDEEGWKKQMEYAKPVFASEDKTEGMMAFIEKRQPRWKGR